MPLQPLVSLPARVATRRRDDVSAIASEIDTGSKPDPVLDRLARVLEEAVVASAPGPLPDRGRQRTVSGYKLG